MREGYIKIYRKMFDNPDVMKDSDHIATWIYLLAEAEWKPTVGYFKGEKITLKPGQFTIGRKQIAEKLRVTESKIQRILKCFENEHLIEQQTSNRNRLITIVKWDEYQQNEQQNEQQMNNQRTTDEQQMNTPEEVKNINNNNNVHREFKKEFEILWEEYPKKQGKKDALRHYMAARKRGTTFEEVRSGIDRYKNYIQATGTDLQFVKMGSSFFNQEAWGNEWPIPDHKPNPRSNAPVQIEPPKYRDFEPEPEIDAVQMPESMRRTFLGGRS